MQHPTDYLLKHCVNIPNFPISSGVVQCMACMHVLKDDLRRPTTTRPSIYDAITLLPQVARSTPLGYPALALMPTSALALYTCTENIAQHRDTHTHNCNNSHAGRRVILHRVGQVEFHTKLAPVILHNSLPVPPTKVFEVFLEVVLYFLRPVNMVTDISE